MIKSSRTAFLIEIENIQKAIAIDIDEIREFVLRTLRILGVPSADLSIVIVTDRKIHDLNKRYLAHDYPTDVITFDLKESGRSSRGRVGPLDGEIIVSATTALRMSKDLGVAPWAELLLYVVHGILHLSGFDDRTPAARRQMRKKESEIMGRLGLRISSRT